MPGTTAMLWAAAVLAQSPAATPDDPMTRVMRELEALRQQNAALAEGLDAMRRENKTLQGSVAELQAQQNEKWLSKEREAEVRQTVAVKQGIDSETAKKIQTLVKQSKLKVQAAIQGDSVRVTGGKRDDLQAAMALLRKDVADVPLAFNNFRD
jgi:uncharacterized protein YajQ (UPF0234 family)